MNLKPIAKSRLSEVAMQHIKALVASERMGPGDRLPTERELVEKLAISRSSVREALRMLEIMGIVEVKPGRGAFIKDPGGDLAVPLASWITLNRATLLKYFEVRMVLEPGCAALAARNATADDIAQLKSRLAEFAASQACGDIVGCIEADMGFHALIGSATGNNILRELIDNIGGMLLDSWKAALRDENRARQSVREHREICEAIAARDEAAARRFMERHLENGLETLRKLRLKNP